MKKAGAVWIVFLMLGPVFFAGCASMERKKAARTEDLLVAAGFTTRKPPTQQELENLKTMKPLKMVRATRDGKAYYIYPDPYKCQCVYVGDERQYAEYRRLAIEQQIAQENLAATEYPGPPYGPWGMWPWWW